MTLEQRGEHYYGQSQQDLQDELRRYGELNTLPVDQTRDCVCECGGRRFELDVDEINGVALRVCEACQSEHILADGEPYLEDAELEGCECLCGEPIFEITAGVHLARNQKEEPTDTVRWFYVGCRCPACGLLGCYADWETDYQGVEELLDNV